MSKRTFLVSAVALGSLAASCSLFVDLDDASGGIRDVDAETGPPVVGDGAPSDATGPSDEYGTGDGHAGPAILSSGVHVVNRYAPLTAPVVAGDTKLHVSAPGDFPPGSLVLVHRAAGAAPDPTRATTLDLAATDVGVFELRRVVRHDVAVLVVDRPWSRTFPIEGAQAVFVPEHTEVAIAVGARIEAKPWDGSTGGVVALLATGDVVNDGAVSADGMGFRGGVAHLDDADNCTQLDGAPENGFSSKGEGIVSAAYDVDPSAPAGGGRGHLANAGGGGNCGNTGGGGGGNSTEGGGGGRAAHDNAPNGGHGGAALIDTSSARLLFGGGGGAGHVDHVAESHGGRGGGVVLLRAKSYRGGGTVTANGAAAAEAERDGAGGGGAGGTVFLSVDGDLVCPPNAIDASGGNGGSTAANHGPGGGGGAGRVRLSSPGTASCSARSLSGVAGIAGPAGSGHNGASPPEPLQGIVEVE